MLDTQSSISQNRPGYNGVPVRAVARALDILQAVNVMGPCSLSDLVTQLELPHATVLRLVRTLQEDGWIDVAPKSKLYVSTPKVLTLSSSVAASDSDTGVTG